jgi:hypothetical protein
MDQPMRMRQNLRQTVDPAVAAGWSSEFVVDRWDSAAGSRSSSLDLTLSLQTTKSGFVATGEFSVDCCRHPAQRL